MSEKTSVRIGCAGGFFGDSPQAAQQLVFQCDPPLDYLVSDYLAEVTMGLLARKFRLDPATAKKQAQRKPATGYIDEVLPLLVVPLVSALADNGTKLVINAGALDPLGLKRAIEAEVKRQGLEDKHKVAAVYGDDIYEGWEKLVGSSAVKAFSHLNVAQGKSVEALPGQASAAAAKSTPRSKMLSLNAYIGAMPIVRALQAGATIVVTGRIVDSAMVVAPLVYEFGWKPETCRGGQQGYLDRLATASLAGHIIECGAQATGGNFTDWRQGALSANGGWSNMGYGVVHFPRHADGLEFYVTKPPDTGGVVSPLSVGEQVLYEVLDPENYLLPDVVLDLSQAKLEQAGHDLVRVSGARGKPPPTHLKCTAIATRGYKVQAELAILGEEARDKAEFLGRAILERARRVMLMRGFDDFVETRVEALGSEALFGSHSRAMHTREVILRISASHADPKALFWLTMEMAQAATSTAPAITGAGSGRARPTPLFSTASMLVERDAVEVRVAVGQEAETSYRHEARGAVAYHELGGLDQGRVSPVVREAGAAGAKLPTPLPSPPRRAPGAGAGAGAPARLPSAKEAHSTSHVSVPLIRIAVGRSGDKGDTANVAFLARRPEWHDVLLQQVTPEVVRSALAHYLVDDDDGAGGKGSEVVRYSVPGLHAVNFVVTRSLGGGGLLGLQLDRQAKSFAQVCLSAIQVRVPAGSFSAL